MVMVVVMMMNHVAMMDHDGLSTGGRSKGSNANYGKAEGE